MTHDNLTSSETLAYARQVIADIENSRNTQADRLAEERARADTAREQCLTEEPWAELVNAAPTYNLDGDITGMIGLPSVDAKAIWGARLAFDLVSRDQPAVDTLSEYFTHIRDTGHFMLVLAEACETFAECIVTPLLEIAEHQGGDYDIRPRLADAARNAWTVRCANPEPEDQQ